MWPGPEKPPSAYIGYKSHHHGLDNLVAGPPHASWHCFPQTSGEDRWDAGGALIRPPPMPHRITRRAFGKRAPGEPCALPATDAVCCLPEGAYEKVEGEVMKKWLVVLVIASVDAAAWAQTTDFLELVKQGHRKVYRPLWIR